MPKEEFKQLLKELRELTRSAIHGYRCIIFAFSGHGRCNNIIFMEDNSRFNLKKEVIHPLERDISFVKKVFLIDACRGSQKTKVVTSRGGSPERKGPQGDIKLSEAPDNGGWVLAYGTMPGHKAYEDRDAGGHWLSILVEHLNKEKTAKYPHAKSLAHILNEVNVDMMKKIPEGWQPQ